MSLNLLKQVAEKQRADEAPPEWVSRRNITFKAFECIQQFYIEKLKYIALHNKIAHFKTKRLYQISASEVARKVGCSTVTLNNTSAYSLEFKAYLARINEDLELEKTKKVDKHKKTLSSGMKQRKKDEISSELQRVRKELKELKKKNAEEQVLLALKALSLPVKYKLGID